MLCVFQRCENAANLQLTFGLDQVSARRILAASLRERIRHPNSRKSDKRERLFQKVQRSELLSYAYEARAERFFDLRSALKHQLGNPKDPRLSPTELMPCHKHFLCSSLV